MSEPRIDQETLLKELEAKGANQRLFELFPSISLRSSSITPEGKIVYFLTHHREIDAVDGLNFIADASLEQLETKFHSTFDDVPLKTFRVIYRKIFPECYLNTVRNTYQGIFTTTILASNEFREFVLNFDTSKQRIEDALFPMKELFGR